MLKIKVYEPVADRPLALKAIDFGLRQLSIYSLLEASPRLVLTIRLFSVGHPTSRGQASRGSTHLSIAIYAKANGTPEELMLTIFHELVHLRQFLSPGVPTEEGVDEEAEKLLKLFLAETQ